MGLGRKVRRHRQRSIDEQCDSASCVDGWKVHKAFTTCLCMEYAGWRDGTVVSAGGNACRSGIFKLASHLTGSGWLDHVSDLDGLALAPDPRAVWVLLGGDEVWGVAEACRGCSMANRDGDVGRSGGCEGPQRLKEASDARAVACPC